LAWEGAAGNSLIDRVSFHGLYWWEELEDRDLCSILEKFSLDLEL
jgi:hypothetical protein